MSTANLRRIECARRRCALADDLILRGVDGNVRIGPIALAFLARGSLSARKLPKAEALREDTQGWWEDVLARDPDELGEGNEPATADAEGLRRFIKAEVLPWFENRKKELTNRPLIREQAFGEALDPDKLERLGRYEAHLDRKLERMLAMLLRLKDLRRGTIEP